MEFSSFFELGRSIQTAAKTVEFATLTTIMQSLINHFDNALMLHASTHILSRPLLSVQRSLVLYKHLASGRMQYEKFPFTSLGTEISPCLEHQIYTVLAVKIWKIRRGTEAMCGWGEQRIWVWAHWPRGPSVLRYVLLVEMQLQAVICCGYSRKFLNSFMYICVLG